MEMFSRNPDTLAAACLVSWALRFTCWILQQLLERLEVPNNGILKVFFSIKSDWVCGGRAD